MYEHWLKAFHAVARTGSFTGAAKSLGVGQPTVSSHVKSIEDHFKVELFHRLGRRIALTDLGQELLTITHGLYGHEAEAIALLRSARGQEIGRLRLAAIRPRDAIGILAGFHARHPKVAINLSLGSTPDILRQMQQFECDIGIVGEEPKGGRFHSQFLSRHRVVVVVSHGHRLARRKVVRLAEIDGEDFILRAKGSTTRAAFDAALARSKVAVRPVLETDSREAVLRAVERGIGIGVITESEPMPLPEIKALTVGDAAIITSAFVVCLAERRSRPLIGSFLAEAARVASG